jgi:hypothetical protein
VEEDEEKEINKEKREEREPSGVVDPGTLCVCYEYGTKY